MKKWVLYSVLSLILLSTFVVMSNPCSASIRVNPSKFIFSLDTGSRDSGAIKVTNLGTKSIQLSAVLYDWTLEDGELVLLREGTRKESLHGSIKFNPRSFELPPGETQVVRFTVSAPDEPFVEKRGIVFFERFVPKSDAPIGADMVIRVGTTIYVSYIKTVSRFHFSEVNVDLSNSNQPRFFAFASNEGDNHIRYWPSYQVIDENGNEVLAETLKEHVILPGMKDTLDFSVTKKLQPGKYLLLLTISFYGTDKRLELEKQFEIPNGK